MAKRTRPTIKRGVDASKVAGLSKVPGPSQVVSGSRGAKGKGKEKAPTSRTLHVTHDDIRVEAEKEIVATLARIKVLESHVAHLTSCLEEYSE